jgi:hypothetical protein
MSDLNKILIKFQEFQLELDLLRDKFIDATDASQKFSAVAQQFLDLESEKPIEEEPVLIGYLNKAQGFKGFKLSDVGTEVFSYKDKYFINIVPLNDGLTIRVNYYKETLKPVINFIDLKQ